MSDLDDMLTLGLRIVVPLVVVCAVFALAAAFALGVWLF